MKEYTHRRVAENAEYLFVFVKGLTDRVCHSRESGNPVCSESVRYWIPAFAGMTYSNVSKAFLCALCVSAVKMGLLMNISTAVPR